MTKDVMAPDGKSFTLEGNVETKVENPNPATLEYTFLTGAGSFIRFTVPAGGSFTVKSAGDFVSATMEVLNISPLGPRPIDEA